MTATAPPGLSAFPSLFSIQHSEWPLKNAKLTRLHPCSEGCSLETQLLQSPKALHSLVPADCSVFFLLDSPFWLPELQLHQPTSGPLLVLFPQPAVLSPSLLQGLPSEIPSALWVPAAS